MLEVAVRHRFGRFDLDAAFTGPSDGVTLLFGPSGAGKSSILAILSGAVRPPGAVIRLDGRDLAALPPERRRIGFVDQDARLFPHMSVDRNLRYGLRRARGRVDIAPGAVIEVLAIGHLLGRWPAALSGGERQRVALGRALLSQPDLLLMDEPLAALDAARKAEILPFLEQLKARFHLPIVYVTHSAAEARRLADHAVLVADGRVTAQGGSELLPRGWAGEVVGVDPATGEIRLRVTGPLPAAGTTVHMSAS